MDMEDERPESIGYQVVNAKACRSEDMGKPAPPRPRPKPGRAAIKNLRQARAPETQERTKEDPVIVYGFICRRLYLFLTCLDEGMFHASDVMMASHAHLSPLSYSY